jgi:hypothetical protein
MILTSITVSVLMWAYPSNPYVWCVLVVLVSLPAMNSANATPSEITDIQKYFQRAIRPLVSLRTRPVLCGAGLLCDCRNR